MEDWRWLGHPQHLCVSYRCQFRLGTHLPNGYVVSTVGEYESPSKRGEFETVGLGRLYETMVFKVRDEREACGCPIIDDLSELDMEGYNDAKSAQEGHLAMCRKWAVRHKAQKGGE